MKLVAAALDRLNEGSEGSDCGAGKKPQLVACREMAPAVMSHIAVRRSKLTGLLDARLLRRLRGFFFLVLIEAASVSTACQMRIPLAALTTASDLL